MAMMASVMAFAGRDTQHSALPSARPPPRPRPLPCHRPLTSQCRHKKAPGPAAKRAAAVDPRPRRARSNRHDVQPTPMCLTAAALALAAADGVLSLLVLLVRPANVAAKIVTASGISGDSPERLQLKTPCGP